MNRWSISIYLLTATWPLLVLAEQPLYQNGHLFIPTVSTPTSVAAYQDVEFEHIAGEEWRLSTVDTHEDRIRDANIHAIELVTTDTLPTQVLLRIFFLEFFWCDEEMGRITHHRDDNHFAIKATIDTTPFDPTVHCIETGFIFRRTIALPVYGLRAGIYTYDVNGTIGSFELTRDNWLEGDCDEWSGCPKL